MKQYLDHCKTILSDERSRYKPNRTDSDTISLFGYQNEYDLSKGFPAVTTKKLAMKSVIHELIWFMSGSDNIKYLVDNGVHIWDENAFEYYLGTRGRQDEFPIYSDKWQAKKLEYMTQIKEDSNFAKDNGGLGPVYGVQWRHWKHWEMASRREIDQFAELIKGIKENPNSRRLIVNAWNVGEVPNMALPPCHLLYQVDAAGEQLDLQLYQRSCDMFLGVPFNIASYASLTNVLAKEGGLKPGRFIHTFGDSHVYCGIDERGKWYGKNLDELKELVQCAEKPEDYLEIKDWIETTAPIELLGKERQDHVPLILEQLSRDPRPLPTMKINPNKSFDELTYEDFELSGYDPHPYIKGAMAV